MRVLRIIASTIASALCVFAVVIAVGYAVLGHMGYRAEPVLSGSMEPTLPLGGIAVVKEIDAAEARVGDVVMFSTPGQKNTLTTHRVAGIERGQAGRAYRTRGDANQVDDPWLLASRGTMGKLVVDVPYVGYATKWVAQPEVRTGVVIFAAFLALLIILRRIWHDESAEPATAQVEQRTAVGSLS